MGDEDNYGMAEGDMMDDEYGEDMDGNVSVTLYLPAFLTFCDADGR